MASDKRPTKTSSRGNSTRTAILAASEMQFAEAGFVASRLTDITERAGVTTGALYRYFEGKDGLLDSLFAELDEQLVAALERSASVETAVHSWLDLYRASAGTIRAVEESTQPGSRLASVVEPARIRWINLLATLLPEGAGTARSRRAAAEIIGAMIEQYALVERMGWIEERPTADVAAAITALINQGTQAR